MNGSWSFWMWGNYWYGVQCRWCMVLDSKLLDLEIYGGTLETTMKVRKLMEFLGVVSGEVLGPF